MQKDYNCYYKPTGDYYPYVRPTVYNYYYINNILPTWLSGNQIYRQDITVNMIRY